MTACHVWVERELALVQPEVLVAMGATAAEALLGKGVSVTRDHGQALDSELARTTLVTIHPSAVLRARDDRDEMYDGFVADLRVAAGAVGRR